MLDSPLMRLAGADVNDEFVTELAGMGGHGAASDGPTNGHTDGAGPSKATGGNGNAATLAQLAGLEEPASDADSGGSTDAAETDGGASGDAVGAMPPASGVQLLADLRARLAQDGAGGDDGGLGADDWLAIERALQATGPR